MKAIETRYQGYRFRSRLEARWAVFFTQLGLCWEYEPEGFVLTDGARYLPDFKVWSPHCLGVVNWFEVKGQAQDPREEKFWRFAMDMALQWENAARQDDKPVPFNNGVLVIGDPVQAIFGEKKMLCPRCGSVDPLSDSVLVSPWTDDWDTGYICHPCDWTTPDGADNDPEKGIVDGLLARPHKGALVIETDSYRRHVDAVKAAAIAARSARFEHGERGAAA